MNQRHRFVIALHAARVHIGNADAHAAQSNSKNARAIAAQLAIVHVRLLEVWPGARRRRSGAAMLLRGWAVANAYFERACPARGFGARGPQSARARA